MEDFAQRMAARIASEHQMATRESAAVGADGEDSEDPVDQESPLSEQDDQDEHQQSELEAAGAGEPQNSPSRASGVGGRSRGFEVFQPPDFYYKILQSGGHVIESRRG